MLIDAVTLMWGRVMEELCHDCSRLFLENVENVLLEANYAI